MQYWLFKSEPGTWSWEDQLQKGEAGEPWDGVRNYQARNNMRAMQLGDRGFFYHSLNEKQVIGVVEIIALAHQDPKTEDPRWECVDIKALYSLNQSVSLNAIKENPALSEMVLVKNSRLSVQPVRAEEWAEIHKMSQTDALE